MGAADKFRDKAEAAEGKAKEAAGRSIDDPALIGEGKTKQVSGDLKQAGEKVKDAFRH